LIYGNTLAFNRIIYAKNFVKFVQKLNLFVSDTNWCGLFAVIMVCSVYTCLLIGCYFLPAIESNDVECTEEGEVFEYQVEEDQGQANQGKPSILDAYLNPIHLLCRFHKGLLNCMFLYCYSSCSNYLLAQAPQANCYHPSR
jgi:antibiotic biosynthesis monooxygenase (ABM) superfamily enzyme